MADMNVKFVSQKISKIRWRPSGTPSLQQSSVFATGSWDDEERQLSVWSVGQNNLEDEIYALDMEDTSVDMEPRLLASIKHSGDVTDLKYFNQELIVSSSSTGSVKVFRHNQSTQTIECLREWDMVHYYGALPCPCTCITTRDDLLVTGGEDGRICVLNIENKQINKLIEKADSCTVNSLIFLRQNEILTTNSTGQLKIFDLRHNPHETPQTLSLSGEHIALMCVDKHPSQQHIVATGAVEGTLCLWDLRQQQTPVTLLEGHSGPMWEVKFHPNYPNHLFTCSEDGSLWHWDASTNTSAYPGTPTGASIGNLSMSLGAGVSSQSTKISSASPWLASDVARHKIDIVALLDSSGGGLSVNSLDIEDDTLLCGSDNESIYTIPLPNLR